MNKLIVENRTNLSMHEALHRVMHVVSLGRISTGSHGKKQYCFATNFKDGVLVYSVLNKNSDRFVLTTQETEDNADIK